MPFQLRRPNGSPMDLPGEVIHLYQQARDVATAMGKIQFLRPAVLAQIIGDFGEHGLHCVERWCARPMTSLDTLQNMCEGLEPLVFEKPVKQQTNEMPGKGRVAGGDAKSVSAFLAGSPVQIPKPKKRLPEGWMTREMMVKWMMDNKPYEIDAADDYFDYHGMTSEFGPIYTLKIRTSQ